MGVAAAKGQHNVIYNMAPRRGIRLLLQIDHRAQRSSLRSHTSFATILPEYFDNGDNHCDYN